MVNHLSYIAIIHKAMLVSCCKRWAEVKQSVKTPGPLVLFIVFLYKHPNHSSFVTLNSLQ